MTKNSTLETMKKISSSIELEKLGKALYRSFAKSLIRNGCINLKKASKPYLIREILKLAKRSDYHLVIDHTSTILKEARLYRKMKKYELSCLLYATWFEHWINGFICSCCRRKKLASGQTNQILRYVSYQGKISLLPILGVKPIKLEHVNRIFRIMDLRNSFVHYKWKGKHIKVLDKEKEEKEEEKALKNVENTVKYLQSFERNYFFGRHKLKITKLM